MRQRRYIGALAVILAMLAAAGAASGRTSTQLPQLVSVVGKAGSFTAMWTNPSGMTSSDIYWTTDPTLATIGTGAHTVDGSYGDPLACEPFGDATDGVGFENTCSGFSNLGDSDRSYTATGVAAGVYYVQVDGFDGKGIGYSNVIKVAVLAGKSSGGGSSGGSTGGTTSSGPTAQVLGGSAQVDEGGQEFQCVPRNCPLNQKLEIGDEVTTPADGYLKVKTANWGTVLIGPNTKFVISKFFADIAGGEVEYEFGSKPKGPCKVFVAPIPPSKFAGKAPPAAKASVDGTSDPNCQGLVFTEQVLTGKIVVDEINGHVTVAGPGGATTTLGPGQETTVSGGATTKPTNFKLTKCNLGDIQFGYFCPKAG